MIADRLHLYPYSETISIMFSYLHGMRPNNRRTALPSPTTAHRSTVPSRYHLDTPPYSAQSPDGSLSYPSPSEADLSVPSPVSPVPPILPPIPQFASQHELREMVEGHGLYIYEKPPGVGQTFDRREEEKKGPYRPMCSSTVTDEDRPAMSEKNERSGISSPQTERQSMTPSNSEDHAQDERARPPRSPFSRINSSFESFQNSSRPRSAENHAFIPQPQRPPPPLPSAPLQTSKPGSSQLPRHVKTKLHILNPMSLLARRRASHAPPETGSEKRFHTKSPSIPGVNLPDDYDPRIRGKVVHDFSAPRSGRSVSSNDLNPSSADLFKKHDLLGLSQHRLSANPNTAQGESPNGMEREHTPIFKEHFEDDLGLDQSSCDMSDKQRSSAFMYQVSFQEPYVDPDSTALPPFARNLQNRLSKAAENANPASPNPPLEIVLESALVESPSHENFVKASPPISPPKARSRASSKAESILQPNGFPKRLKSNASRFSFDLAGVGSSAQEKLLEEKHRQKAKQRLRDSDISGMSNATDDQNDAHEEYSASEYDDMDDDGLEEKIPGVNADSDYTLFPMSRHATENLQPSLSIETNFPDPMSTGLSSKVAHGNLLQHSGPALQFLTNQAAIDSSFPSLTMNGTELRSQSSDACYFGTNGHPIESANGPLPQLAGLPPRRMDDEDDLYFDDGIIDDLEDRDDQVFDESLFDDESSRIYGLPLRDLKKPPASQPQDRDDTPGDNSLSPPDAENSKAGGGLTRVDSRDSFIEHSRDSHPAFSQAASLTKDNLEAYHDALAFAANQAALNGEFNRRKSLVPSGQDEAANDVDSAPGMTPDDGRTSGEINGHFYGQGMDDPEGFDFDDALSDDPIIAAANAEALENDDEGFYGQEFGFFARANGPAEYVNGGYFGPPGTNGIGRSHSGRVNFQEPSLTPITERSEWSHRNSAISLAIHGYPPSMDPALASPGLAHLTDIMTSREEDNMSLSALMKLRRSAWGDSNTSLHSSGSQSQISGSPLNNVHTFPHLPLATSSKHQPPFSSTFSLGGSSGMNSSDSSDTSPSSPTITLATHIPATTAPAATSSPRTDTWQISPQLSRTGAVSGHSRTNSGAESVSYVHERDEEGDRWVVEKRRLVGGGKVEVLGREVLQGAMI